MSRMLAAIAIAGNSLAGCAVERAKGGAEDPRVPVPLPAELSGLSVLTATAPAISMTDPDCATYPSGTTFPQKLRDGLETAMTNAGISVVTDASRAHDVTMRVKVDFSRCIKPAVGPGWPSGTVTVSLEADGTVIATSRTGAGGTLTDTDGQLWDAIPRSLLKGLAASQALVEFAKRRKDAVAVVAAPASGPSAAAIPSPPPPAPPSAPPPSPASASPSTYVAGAPQPNAYAVIVGIERYSAGLPPPTGARADAQRFADLAKKLLGLSAAHVHLVVDDQATKGTLESEIEWLRSSVPPGGRAYFYFSGHGAPDASAGASYLVPFDGNPKFLPQTSLLLSDVLNRLGQSKAREVLAVFDSCFSGAGGRSVLPPGARPLVRLRETAPAAQVALFSASSGAEISGPAPGGGGGLFTQFLVQGLGTGAADIDGDGQVSLQELSDWTRPRVAREAKKENRDQTPNLAVGTGIGGASSFIVEWGLPAR